MAQRIDGHSAPLSRGEAHGGEFVQLDPNSDDAADRTGRLLGKVDGTIQADIPTAAPMCLASVDVAMETVGLLAECSLSLDSGYDTHTAIQALSG